MGVGWGRFGEEGPGRGISIEKMRRVGAEPGPRCAGSRTLDLSCDDKKEEKTSSSSIGHLELGGKGPPLEARKGSRTRTDQAIEWATAREASFVLASLVIPGVSSCRRHRWGTRRRLGERGSTVEI